MLLTVIVIVSAVLLDFVSKCLAYNFLSEVSHVNFLGEFLSFTYVTNRGAAGGMLSEHRWVFMVFSVIAIIAVFYYLLHYKPKSLLLRWSLSLILAGGIGNMIDRTFLGYVIDFIDMPWLPWVNVSLNPFSVSFVDFPIFNIADCCVTIGAFLVIAYLIVETVKEAKKGKNKNDGTN